jgi:hypothetical protein
MTLLALMAALALERHQADLPVRPREMARRWMAWLLDNLNAGGEQHGLLAWSLGVLAPALAWDRARPAWGHHRHLAEHLPRRRRGRQRVRHEGANRLAQGGRRPVLPGGAALHRSSRCFQSRK